MKRIKHNDLTHYFMTPHEQLPASYLASCKEFFTAIEQLKKEGTIREIKKDVYSLKRQASSSKRQASSNKLDTVGFSGKR